MPRILFQCRIQRFDSSLVSDKSELCITLSSCRLVETLACVSTVCDTRSCYTAVSPGVELK
ncbi:hypothetical protein F383_25214 [Gossypium arboreum]|uniref:Uncharacterized protein n=1 Tax=Gossypium arboreum TaxID=29729 RepID=A0A0B0P2T9_GOSAR|nr:hypothetical protein F383_25214 [Gossypium arboreum]